MSSLSLWGERNPFAEFDALARRTFGAPTYGTRPFGTGATTRRTTTGFTPAAEVVWDGDDALVRVEVPGVDVTEDVTVEVDGDQLVVRGERRDDRSEQRRGVSLREVRYGSFRRSFTLPAHVSADAISASYDAGVLSVRVTGAYAGNAAHRIPVELPSPTPAAEDDGERPAA